MLHLFGLLHCSVPQACISSRWLHAYLRHIAQSTAAHQQYHHISSLLKSKLHVNTHTFLLRWFKLKREGLQYKFLLLQLSKKQPTCSSKYFSKFLQIFHHPNLAGCMTGIAKRFIQIIKTGILIQPLRILHIRHSFNVAFCKTKLNCIL